EDCLALSVLPNPGRWTAGAWYASFRARHDARTALARAREALEDKVKRADLPALIREAEEAFFGPGAERKVEIRIVPREERFGALVEACRRARLLKQAWAYFLRWAADDKVGGRTVDPWRRLGDLEAEEGNWLRAATHYQRAWEGDPSDATLFVRYG